MLHTWGSALTHPPHVHGSTRPLGGIALAVVSMRRRSPIWRALMRNM
jgi:hypothetical protein